MDIKTTTPSGWTVLELSGAIDQAGATQLGEQLEPLMTGGNVGLKFDDVPYVTSSGFRILLKCYKDQNAHGGRLLLGNMSDSLRNYFDLAGLSPVFGIVADVDAVVAGD